MLKKTRKFAAGGTTPDPALADPNAPGSSMQQVADAQMKEWAASPNNTQHTLIPSEDDVAGMVPQLQGSGHSWFGDLLDKYGPVLVGAAGAAITGGALAPVMGAGLAGAAATGAGAGAVGSALPAAINGQPIGRAALQGAVGGAFGGGIGQGINSGVSDALGGGTLGDVAGGAISRGAGGALQSAIAGGNPLRGLERGAITGGLGALGQAGSQYLSDNMNINPQLAGMITNAAAKNLGRMAAPTPQRRPILRRRGYGGYGLGALGHMNNPHAYQNRPIGLQHG